jgi:hypothetical protein
MGAQSFIYRHLFIYRFVMNILYLGHYKKRFNQVIEQIKDLPSNSQILELCFGDIYIAEYSKRNGYRWKGIDLNQHFVKQAQKLGYEAYKDDLTSLKNLPKADVCIMIGSLYHFHPNTFSILRKMLEASDTIVISEPVENLSSKKGIIGFLAQRAANAGKRNEVFRYNATTLNSFLKENCDLLIYHIAFSQRHRKDLLIKLIKNGSN